MGYDAAKLTVTARLSSHNDERDDQDRALWARFMADVRRLAEAPEYDDILIMVDEI